MLYDNFIRLCEEKGVSPTRVLITLDISKGSLSRWKDGGEPRNETKKKIADYFGITIQQLNYGETKNAPTPKREDAIKNDIIDLNKEERSIQIIHRAAKKMSPENRQKLIDIAKVMFDEEFDDD